MSDNVSLVDFNKFRTEIGVDDETLKELYEFFLQELIQQKENMKVQIEKEEIKEVKKILHNIKGISGNYKAIKVYELSSKVYDELRVKGKDYSELNYMINKIEKLIDEAINEIKEFLK